VPGHAGVKDNERVNRLADIAVEQSRNGNGLDSTGIFNVLMDNFRISEASNDHESTMIYYDQSE
jgi:hypothetical protein